MSLEGQLRAVLEPLLHSPRDVGNGEIKAKCPFHRKEDGSMERGPSFYVSLEKGVYFCFSCQSAGNMRGLFEYLSSPTDNLIIKHDVLLGQLQSQAPAVNKTDPTKPKVLTSLVEPLPERVLGFFDQCPVSLVDDDFFEEEVLEHFGVGYDATHKRITYPLRDLAGNLIAISGRLDSGRGPRYKVYTDEYKAFDLPERPHPEKGMLMWNAHAVYTASLFQRLETPVYVVEGFKALMRVWSAGLHNVVALMGCHLTEHHEWILQRIGAPVCLMLDQNEAGIRATHTIGRILQKSLPRVLVATYPGEQPSDCHELELVESSKTAELYSIWSLRNPQVKKR